MNEHVRHIFNELTRKLIGGKISKDAHVRHIFNELACKLNEWACAAHI